MAPNKSAPTLIDLEATYERSVPRIHFYIELTMSEYAAARVTDILRGAVVPRSGGRSAQDFVRKCPLVYARWLVGLASDVYDQGTLWPHVSTALGRGDSSYVGQLLGPLFLQVLEAFDGIRFPGHRYVANILGHSAVPEHILPDLLKMIEGARARLPQNAPPVTLWNALTNDTALPYAAKPLRRFFETGPEVGADYVQSLRRFLEDPMTAAVSPAVHRAYWSLKTGRPKSPKQTRGAGSPQIITDYTDRPLVIAIPSALGDKAHGWSVWIDGKSVSPHADWLQGQEGKFEIPRPCDDVAVHRDGVVVLAAKAVTPGVWLFDESAHALANAWVTRGSYTAVMRKDWQVAEGQVVLEEAPWLDDWRGWKLVSLTVEKGQCIRMVDSSGATVYRAPVVEPLYRTVPDGTIWEVQAGSPIGLSYSGDVSGLGRVEFHVTVVSPSRRTSRLTVPLSGTGPYEIRLDDVSGEIGAHQVTVGWPSGSDTLEVRVIPRYTPRIPTSLLWPRPGGLHRSGTVRLDVSAEVRVAGWDSAREPGQYHRAATRETYELEARMTWRGEEFSQTFPIRNVWWEWVSSDYATVANSPLHTAFTALNGKHWTLRLWQHPEWETDLRLIDDVGTVRWRQPVIGKGPFNFNYTSWADAIGQATGQGFRLLAIPQRDRAVGLFTLAWIQRPVFNDLRVDFSRNIVRWGGPDPGDCTVTITSCLLGVEQYSTASRRPLMVQGQWECPLATVNRPLPLLRIQVRSARHRTIGVARVVPPARGAPKFRRVSGDTLDTLANQFVEVNTERSDASRWDAYHRWVNQQGSPILPKHDAPGWVAAFRMLPDSARVGAYRQVVAPTIHRDMPTWFDAAVRQWDSEDALVLLGFPQWPLGVVSTRTAEGLLKHRHVLTHVSPVINWLLLTGTETFDPGQDRSWVEKLFGVEPSGDLVGAHLLRDLETADNAARSFVAEFLRDVQEQTPLTSAVAVGAPAYMPTEAMVDRASQKWLYEGFLELSSPQGFLRQAEHLWADVSISEHVLMWTACLQRARAYGLVQDTVDDDARLYALSARQYLVAPEAYKRAILQADLLVGHEHIIQVNQE